LGRPRRSLAVVWKAGLRRGNSRGGGMNGQLVAVGFACAGGENEKWQGTGRSLRGSGSRSRGPDAA
jgi:hypothetical protein